MKRVLILASFVILSAAASNAQQPDKADAKPEDPVHAELRQLRDELIKAVNANDPEKLLPYLDEDIVVTWQNGEVSRKPSGVKAYYDRMMKGEKRVVDSVSTKPQVDELAHLYGDTAVALGSSQDRFKLADGRDFVFDDRWTATAVKKGDKWLLTSFHISGNLFDNAVNRYAVRTTALWSGGTALVVGLLAGLLFHWFRSRKVKPA